MNNDEKNKDLLKNDVLKSNIISTDEKVCYNCSYRIWAVAIGAGVRCGYNTQGRWPPLIKGLRATCDAFKMSEDENRKPFQL